MATLIRVDGTTTDVQLSGAPGDDVSGPLATLQALVGGYIQVLCLPDGRFLVLDEDGKRGKPLNAVATALARPVLQPGDYLVGDVVVCRVTGAGTDDETWS